MENVKLIAEDTKLVTFYEVKVEYNIDGTNESGFIKFDDFYKLFAFIDSHPDIFNDSDDVIYVWAYELVLLTTYSPKTNKPYDVTLSNKCRQIMIRK